MPAPTEYRASRRGRSAAPRKTTDQLVAEIRRLATAARRAAAAATSAADDLARGTGDVTEQARAAGRANRQEPAEAVGDDAPPEVLFRQVERLLRERPHTEEELVEATGARRNRVRGALVHFNRFGPEVRNIGKNRRAQWWIPRE